MLSEFRSVATPEIRWVHVESREAVAIDKKAIRLPPVGRGGPRESYGLRDIVQDVCISENTLESMLQAKLFHDEIVQGFAHFVVSVKFLDNMRVLQSFNKYTFTGELSQIAPIDKINDTRSLVKIHGPMSGCEIVEISPDVAVR